MGRTAADDNGATWVGLWPTHSATAGASARGSFRVGTVNYDRGQVVALEVGGSSPLAHPFQTAVDALSVGGRSRCFEASPDLHVTHSALASF